MAELDGVLACTRGFLVRADDLVVVESSWAAILQDCDHILGQCCYRVGGRVSGVRCPELQCGWKSLDSETKVIYVRLGTYLNYLASQF